VKKQASNQLPEKYARQLVKGWMAVMMSVVVPIFLESFVRKRIIKFDQFA
jgi:hypothetical protein